mmetsp:Transcript_21788/g.20921  ORF Transcript_21788/g.20921 Transcript_21788/m.20921 type:complete len:573 (-) Transcript_21788:291-2009(-)
MTATRVRMTVDVSLCGSIPRSHMPHLQPLPKRSVCNSSCRSLDFSRRPPSLPRLLSTAKPSTSVCTEQVYVGETGHNSMQQLKQETGASDDTGNKQICSDEGISKPQQNCNLSREEMISLAALSLRQHGNNCSMAQLGQHLSSSRIEPPSWAVSARGETRLEPVCETAKLQNSVDLTSRPCFSIGRSPGSDIQLFHDNSSRRHALLFHHPNGSCYIADCGSVHGTFVNGVRVQSLPSHHLNGKPQQVAPHRVKRGALIRFGGEGAPSFVLKSFSVGFDTLARNITGETVQLKVLEEISAFENEVSDSPTLAPSKATILMMKPSPPKDTSVAGLVLLNTRMNALGGPSVLSQPNLSLAKKTLNKLSMSGNLDLQQLLQYSPTLLKRSFDQIDSRLHMPCDGPLPKKRCNHFFTEEVTRLNVEDSIMPIVSPTRSSNTTISLQFPVSNLSPITMTSTDMINPNGSNTDLTPNPCHSTSNDYSFPVNNTISLLPPPPLFQRRKKRGSKKVCFSSEKPESFFPPSVTPDASSDDEDGNFSKSVLNLNKGQISSCSPAGRLSLLPLAPRTPRVPSSH